MKKTLLILILIVLFGYTGKATSYQIGVGMNNTPTFTPPTLSVNVGDTIIFTWLGSQPYCTESISIPVGATPWSEQLMFPNITFTYVVSVAGVYNYACPMYTGMTGTFTAASGCSAPSNVNLSGDPYLCPPNYDTLSVTATNAVSYQWFVNGSPINGATDSTYVVTSFTGVYSCMTYSNCDSTLSNLFPVNSSVQPTNVSVVSVGDTFLCQGVVDTLILTANDGYYYQWSLNGSPISGATDTFLYASLPGMYNCSVFSYCYSQTMISNQIDLTIVADPVINNTNTGNTYNFSISAPNATSWNWDFGDLTANSNLQNPQHTYVTAGTYTVIATVNYSNGCIGADTVTVQTSTNSISIIENESLTISPNPATNVLQVTNSNSNIVLDIYDISGKWISTLKRISNLTQETNYDVSNLNSGLYFLRLSSDGRVSFSKLTITK